MVVWDMDCVFRRRKLWSYEVDGLDKKWMLTLGSFGHSVLRRPQDSIPPAHYVCPAQNPAYRQCAHHPA